MFCGPRRDSFFAPFSPIMILRLGFICRKESATRKESEPRVWLSRMNFHIQTMPGKQAATSGIGLDGRNQGSFLRLSSAGGDKKPLNAGEQFVSNAHSGEINDRTRAALRLKIYRGKIEEMFRAG